MLRCLPIVVALACLAPAGSHQTVTALTVCGPASYAQLTEPWKNLGIPRKIMLGTAPVELTIQSTQFSDRPVTAHQAAQPDFCRWSSSSVGVQVSRLGEGYAFDNDSMGSRGGGGGKIPADKFARLQSLMRHLPPDHHRIPPPNHRVIVAVQDTGTASVRLYDSANLPESIIEMFRLTGVRIPILAPILPPESSAPFPAPAGRPPSFSPPFVSPNGAIRVVHNDFGTKKFTIHEVGKPVRELAEFWQPVEGGYGVNGEFSPDSRYLLVSWGNHVGALLFDTRTWQPVTDPRQFPQDLKEYLPSRDWSLGIAVTARSTALIWDQPAHRVVSKLPGLGELEPARPAWDRNGRPMYDTPNGEIRSATFSSDLRRVAIFSGPEQSAAIGFSVWNVKRGRKLLDLWPVEWDSYPWGPLQWWNGDRWLVARYAGQFSPDGMGLWDARSGRYLATFDVAGCDTRISPSFPTVNRDQLLLHCPAVKDSSPHTLVWDLAAVQRQLRAGRAR